MKTLESIFGELKKPGMRLTAIRKATVTVLSKSKKPLCAEGIINKLATQKLKPNKTTVYRELEFLMAQGFVHELDFGAGRKCYEWASEHHHHLVCRECRRVEEIETCGLEPAFEKFEKALSLKSGFTSVGHSLEFYGVCKKCKT